MFCQQCGESLQSDAKFCGKCGAPTIKPAVGLSTPDSTPNVAIREAIAIWNPNAAINWSIIFTPAFGSYLHALNWRSLGKEDQVKSAMGWFYFSLAMLVVYILMGIFMADEKAADGAARGLALLYLIIWYFSAGKAQTKYVKTEFSSDYPRRSWGKPLLIGIAAIACYFVLAVALGFIIGIISA
jgi:hypothetical protein